VRQVKLGKTSPFVADRRNPDGASYQTRPAGRRRTVGSLGEKVCGP